MSDTFNLDRNMIVCENLVKIYKTKDIEVLALQGLDLVIEKGELTAIIGSSGSGKSTLLNMIGGIDRPSAGKLYVDGKDLFKLTNKELVAYKANSVGFVWQNNARNLISYLSAIENVIVPMRFNKKDNISRKRERAMELLNMTGIGHRATSKLNQLSGGEQQRVALAIALANNPKLVLADEPTGSVDTKTSNYILDMFRTINNELGVTVVIVTHDQNMKRKVDRVVAIRDGKTSSELIMKNDLVKKDLIDLDNIANIEDTHNEYAVLDRAGRIQIPRNYLENLSLNGNKLKLEMNDEKIIITKPENK